MMADLNPYDNRRHSRTFLQDRVVREYTIVALELLPQRLQKGQVSFPRGTAPRKANNPKPVEQKVINRNISQRLKKVLIVNYPPSCPAESRANDI